MATKNTVHLDDEELDTILKIARNQQSGRITEYEIKELVRGYRASLATQKKARRCIHDALADA